MKKWYFLLFIAFVSCRNSDEPEQASRLLDVQEVKEMKKEEVLQLAAPLIGDLAPLIGGALKHDIKLYKVRYSTTTTDGREIIASGALVMPINAPKVRLLSIQHGTQFEESDAPSYFKSGTESLLALFMGAAGFATAMPDYVGYGESKAEPHPYEHAEGLAVPAVDYLLAVKEYMKASKTDWDNRLYLAGYSAGGYATLATQKLIEERFSKEFNLVGSSCGAGAHNKSLLLDLFVNEPTAGEANHNRSYIWVLQTYNRIYNWKKPMSYFFKEPYASAIEQNGYKVNFTGSFNTLLNPSFVSSYNGGGEEEIRKAFKENDLVHWKSLTQTLLLHGDADTYVPYINSKSAYEGMTQAGSPKVSLVTVQGGTHESSIQEFILRTYIQFGANP
jgi:pimeloyl-ACP methyl ester carboxylesterase